MPKNQKSRNKKEKTIKKPKLSYVIDNKDKDLEDIITDNEVEEIVNKVYTTEEILDIYIF